MPYAGIPDSLTPKMEACVVKMQAGGKTKQEAIAICHAAIMKKDLDSFIVLKELDGAGYRWVSYASNNFRDRDTRYHPKGEIITEKAHLEFIDYLDRNPSMAPEWWTWHTPGTARKSRADFWDYVDGFLVLSGPATESEAKAYKNPQEEMGVSIGFFALERKKDEGLILKYRAFENSDLPVDAAANPWTNFAMFRKELEMGFTPAKRAYLVSKLGEPQVIDLEANPSNLATALKAAGIEQKDYDAVKDAAEAASATAKTTAETTETTAAVTEKDEVKLPQLDAAAQTLLTAALPAIMPHILKELNLEGLQETLVSMGKSLEEFAAAQKSIVAVAKELSELKLKVESLSTTEDDAIAKAISGKNAAVRQWGYQPSAAKDNKISDKDLSDEDADLSKAGPNLDWVKSIGAIVPA